MADLRQLIEGSDLDGLVMYADGLVASRDWPGLVEMRDMCNEATERGKQVWGAAQFAEYRLALDAPAEFAIPVIKPGAGRFANGPLWEVAASTHSWDELRALEDPALRALIAHERLIRGDHVDDPTVDRSVVDAPLELASWEPDYPVAIYKSDRADFPELDVLTAHSWVDLPATVGEGSSESAPVTALLDLVEPWLESSNGRGEGAAVIGGELAAIRAIGPRRARIEEVSLTQAVAAMAWTGASGGAYGRRRGTPVGRALALWALAALTGLDDDWPIPLDELGEAGSEMRWFLWDPGDQVGGWNFHMAVGDPVDGLAWAVSAVDAV
ncbi:MAG: hypothetical protein HKN91_01320 [Acidimicrobiia bacterium]|nr:hypothetical protein [Acidimicrobiia bacterium]